MRALLLITCFASSYLAASCAKDDLFCVSNAHTSASAPTPSSNHLLADGIQTGIAGYSEVGNLLDRAAMERAGRYATSKPARGYTTEQIQNLRESQQRNWQKEQEVFKKKIAATLAVPQELKQSFQKSSETQQAILETLRNIKVPKPEIPQSKSHNSEKKESELPNLFTHYLSAEGKSIRQIISQALLLKPSQYRNFIIDAAMKADQLSAEKAGRRWLERANHAYAYWTDQPVKVRLITESLNDAAKTAFGLPEMKANTFEHYEIIRAAKLLSFESGLSQHEDLRLQASLALKQALIYARDGDTDLVVQMTENVYAIKDFLKGFAGGIKQNIYDTASGLWQTITHPMDSAEALSYALVHYKETLNLISNSVHQIIDEYPTYTSEQKGILFGKITSEISSIFIPLGALKNIKLGKAIEHATEGIVSSHASNIADARKLANQLKLESARSPFTETGRLTEEVIASTKKCIKSPAELKNPAIPSDFGKFSTDTFQSPAGDFQIHFYKNLKTEQVYYELDYKIVFNVSFGQR